MSRINKAATNHRFAPILSGAFCAALCCVLGFMYGLALTGAFGPGEKTVALWFVFVPRAVLVSVYLGLMIWIYKNCALLLFKG